MKESELPGALRCNRFILVAQWSRGLAQNDLDEFPGFDVADYGLPPEAGSGWHELAQGGMIPEPARACSTSLAGRQHLEASGSCGKLREAAAQAPNDLQRPTQQFGVTLPTRRASPPPNQPASSTLEPTQSR